MPKRKKKLAPRYLFARLFVAVVALAIISVPAWFAAKILLNKSSGKTTQSNQIPVNASVGNAFDSDAAGPLALPDVATAVQDKEPSSTQSSSDSAAESSSDRVFDSDLAETETLPDTADTVPEDDWALTLVNSENPLPEDYDKTLELETITGTYQVDSRIADNVRLMFADAKAVGINLTILSAFRSVEKQSELYEQKVQEYANLGEDRETAAAKVVAAPGTSEHNTGLALDIVTPSYMKLDSGFAQTPAFGWLDKNAYIYGFILRYPEDKQEITSIIYEPWHYRYVGKKHAAAMKSQNLCLEEYVSMLKTPDKDEIEPEPEQDRAEAEIEEE